MNKILHLIDRFCDRHPDTELAVEWRELSADKAVRMSRYIQAAEKYGSKLPPELQNEVRAIKGMLAYQ